MSYAPVQCFDWCETASISIGYLLMTTRGDLSFPSGRDFPSQPVWTGLTNKEAIHRGKLLV